MLIGIGAIGGIAYYAYNKKKREKLKSSQNVQTTQPHMKINKFEMEKKFFFHVSKSMDKKSFFNDLYHSALISVFAIEHVTLFKNGLKITPPSVQTFDLEDTRKLVAIITTAEMTQEYLIKQKLLPENITVQ